jgi:hypothetical protein
MSLIFRGAWIDMSLLRRSRPWNTHAGPFFDGIRIESESNKLCWRLTGREGLKRFIRAEFGAWVGRLMISRYGDN